MVLEYAMGALQRRSTDTTIALLLATALNYVTIARKVSERPEREPE